MRRSLTETEAAVLRQWLDHDVDGIVRLRAQLDAGVLVFASCECGCPSIGFVHSIGIDPSVGTSIFPIDAVIFDEAGTAVGGMVLFLKAGELHDIDIHTYDETDLLFPTPERVRWERR
jgi:hypothetical protein